MRKTVVIVCAAFISLTTHAAELLMKDGWVRASIPGAANGAAYLTLENNSERAVTLVGMSSAVSDTTELHRHTHADGMMKMEHVPEKTITPGESLMMKPGGYHVMLMGLKQPLQENQSIRIVLDFADGTQQVLDVGIRKP